MDATGLGELIGSSALMIDLREEVDRIGKSDAKVLLTGERGVGKELVARAIHARSARAASPLLTMNCAGLPDTLLEWELFGHGNGSLKGGSRDLPGKLELANRGMELIDDLGAGRGRPEDEPFVGPKPERRARALLPRGVRREGSG